MEEEGAVCAMCMEKWGWAWYNSAVAESYGAMGDSSAQGKRDAIVEANIFEKVHASGRRIWGEKDLDVKLKLKVLLYAQTTPRHQTSKRRIKLGKIFDCEIHALGSYTPSFIQKDAIVHAQS